MKIVSQLPAGRQDEIARVVLTLAGEEEELYQLTPEEEASFAKSLDQAARREFASDVQVHAVFSKYAS